ncbi:GNAT family N-acetyltransferase [Nocardioides bruguierae]|uniref:GNAT family N-acetyltransferase n=1 Tax=Nocardioides bruguierae TaxID=2945102 RepID=A0A9X2D6A5_9ACTN|nr:GNAT family N-acetyltransferase [Nocardioides bruguierae]MCM0620055.1 GNAT family N-acetyltransferase [Nocardioides bruguierae]
MLPRPAHVDLATLVATHPDPFVTHQVNPGDSVGAWTLGDAVVLDGNRTRGGVDDGRPGLWCTGPAVDLDPLMAHVEPLIPRPGRVSVEETSFAALPASWRYAPSGHWHWMLTRTAPRHVPGEDAVTRLRTEGDDLADVDALEALLDVANPDSFARAGTPGVEGWLGVRGSDGSLVAAGAIHRDPDGTGHLRGVTTHPAHRGRGLGAAVSAALTRWALAGAAGTATLGVYVDNAPALAVYDRLGFTTHHTFVSGRPVPPPSRQ